MRRDVYWTREGGRALPKTATMVAVLFILFSSFRLFLRSVLLSKQIFFDGAFVSLSVGEFLMICIKFALEQFLTNRYFSLNDYFPIELRGNQVPTAVRNCVD